MFSKFLAAQLRRPSGFFGRFILLRSLNRINRNINTLAFEHLHLMPDDFVLEIGFGGGDLISRIIRIIVNGHVTGVDFSSDVVKACSKRFKEQIAERKIDLHVAYVDALPFEEETFTKVCTVNTIYFWPDPPHALIEIHRVLKKGGIFVLCFTTRSSMKGREVMNHGFTLYEPEEVRALLSGAGFVHFRTEYGKDLKGECVAIVAEK